MQVIVKDFSVLKTYTKMTEDQKDVDFKLFCDCLALFQKDKIVAKFQPTNLSKEILGTKLVIYNKPENEGKKTVLMEVTATEEQIRALAHLINRHNHFTSYRTPIQWNPSQGTRESLLSSGMVSNLRGFMNLFIIYSILTYSRLVVENLVQHSTVFKDTVKLSDWWIFEWRNRRSLLFVLFCVCNVLSCSLLCGNIKVRCQHRQHSRIHSHNSYSRCLHAYFSIACPATQFDVLWVNQSFEVWWIFSRLFSCAKWLVFATQCTPFVTIWVWWSPPKAALKQPNI